MEKVLPLFRIPAIGQGDRVERIDRFVTVRLRLYDAVAATARATRMRATFDDVVRRQLEVTRAALHDQVERHFAPELGPLDAVTRRSRVAAVDTLTQFESLDHCRLHLDLTPSDTRSMLTDTLATLLAPYPDPLRPPGRAPAGRPSGPRPIDQGEDPCASKPKESDWT